VSWIAAEDMFALLRRAVTNDVMSGTYHLTAPEPVTNREFMAAYRRALGRRFGLPAPRILTQVGARLLGSDPALVLTGRAALPRRLLDEGYTFAVTDLDEAVDRAISVMT
jgi:NAD dependent epimerase/dehydratase family enzyme